MNRTLRYCFCLCLVVTGALGLAAQTSRPIVETALEAPAASTISVDEITRGQKGYGLSVFAGSTPERFEVEVLGVVRNSKPEVSYILARLSGQDLERAGVSSGMSGSPVFLDGRLAGAVSYSYLFNLDAVAGITPIDAMRKLGELPGATGTPAAAPAPAELAVSTEAVLKRQFPDDLLERHLAQLRLAAPAGLRPSIGWAASGFGEAATELLRGSLGELVPVGASAGSGGAMDDSGETLDLVPGGGVAAVLVQGDLTLAGYGTVTDRRGDEILAFGHPMFGLGPINVPMAPAEVVTVVASAANSFKISNAGPVIGAIDQDRDAGLRGRIGAVAPTTPLAVRLRGLAERDYRMEITNLPQLRPLLIAVSTLGAMTAGSYTGGYQGVDLDARIAIEGHDDLVIRQSFDGSSAVTDSVLHVLGFTSFLEFNPLQTVELESVEVELTQVDRPRTATLIAAHPARTRVTPGETVDVHLTFQPYRGERYRETIEVAVPEEAPDGRYLVLIGDGSSMDAVKLSLESRTPETFDQVLELLRSYRTRRELVTFGLLPRPGLAVAGDVLPALPGSVRSIFAAGGPAMGAPVGYDLADETVRTLERPVEGAVRIDLEVRRSARQ